MSQTTMSETEELSPPDILHAWQAEAECLQKELARLETSTSLVDVDALAFIKVKLNHIEARVPELERDAANYEHAQLRERIRARDEPRWAESAHAKRDARTAIVLACEALLAAVAQYTAAHGQQMSCVRDIPMSPVQRGLYSSMPTGLGQTLAVVASGNPDASAWLARVRGWDEVPGCDTVLPYNGNDFPEG
jgi:hypothetical protein